VAGLQTDGQGVISLRAVRLERSRTTELQVTAYEIAECVAEPVEMVLFLKKEGKKLPGHDRYTALLLMVAQSV